jgi:hypothetical protein
MGPWPRPACLTLTEAASGAASVHTLPGASSAGTATFMLRPKHARHKLTDKLSDVGLALVPHRSSGGVLEAQGSSLLSTSSDSDESSPGASASGFCF